MSTTTNEKQPFYGPAQESSVDNFGASLNYSAASCHSFELSPSEVPVDNFGASLNYPAASCHSFELSPSEVTVDNFGASLNYPATSCYSFANTTEAVLYDNGETFNILNSEDDVRAGQTALLSTEFNHADIPNWNYNSTGDIASTSLDPVTNFQNCTPLEQNTASSNDGYLQGVLDGIDMGINFNWQEMNVLAPAPTEQGFISGEVDANTVLIGQQATPSAPVIGPFANHVAPALVLRATPLAVVKLLDAKVTAIVT
ncbi:hypothetical protein H4I95_08540 [Botrytis cinerea]